MSIRSLLARQLGRPSGLAGLFMGRALNRVNKRVNTLALDRLAPEPTTRLLDVGFGGGLLLQQALPRIPQGQAVGIEISDAMLVRARKVFRTAIAEGRLEVREGNVLAIPFPDNRFDRAITVNTMHFWPDPQRGCQEIYRVLAPGGRLVLAVRPKRYLERIDFTNHGFAVFEDEELRQLFDAAGFVAVAIEHHDDKDMGIVLVTGTKDTGAG